ncbi:hypothetical protein [Sporosarcina sp. ITBMC105]
MEFRGRALKIHVNEDGTHQLRDSLSRFWCACSKPATSYLPGNYGPYNFQCDDCIKKE